jgi:putative two-component system response regulator
MNPTKLSGKVVVIEDVEENLEHITTVLERDGYTVVGARDGAEGLDVVLRERPDLVLTDVVMPRINGFEVCRRLKGDRETRLIPVVLVTGLAERSDRIQGIDAGADDFLTKPFDGHELRARVRSLVRLKRFTDDLDRADSVILSLGLTVEARDRYTMGHCERMARFGGAFGVHLGLSDEEISALHRGGYLHDVGKVGIPDAILLKTGPLEPGERALMEKHPVIGEGLCGDLRLLRPVRPIIRWHHERLDGSGYPDGLREDAIPLLAQMMGIVDVFDALTTDRVYRNRLSWDDACLVLQEEAARGWRNPHLVDEFISLCRSGRLETPVETL